MRTTTYSIREVKARLSEILRAFDHGKEVIITRRGRPCGRLAAVDTGTDDKPSLAMLRGARSHLPDADYQDFQGVWETQEQSSDGITGEPDGSPDPVRWDTHALWWYFRSPERLSAATSLTLLATAV